jgi:hypothetical protein
MGRHDPATHVTSGRADVDLFDNRLGEGLISSKSVSAKDGRKGVGLLEWFEKKGMGN